MKDRVYLDQLRARRHLRRAGPVRRLGIRQDRRRRHRCVQRRAAQNRTRLTKLLALENVIATPHIGANTVEAQRDVAVQIVQQVIDALRGLNFRNVVNLPFAEGVDYRSLAPYMTLAEKIGSLQMQLIHGRIDRVEVEFRGEEVEAHVKPLTVALLKGMLAPILSDAVNYVNAPRLAEERGITVAQTRHPAAEDYSNVILCRAHSNKETRLIGGALFLHTQSRIVLLDEFRIDALPHGPALILANRDVPGVIGKVGTLLGAHGINIAEWQMGRIGSRRRGGVVHQHRFARWAMTCCANCARCRRLWMCGR